MLDQFSESTKVLLSVVMAPSLYVIAIALGRFLKRRVGLQLGVMYKLLCVALSVYLPLELVYGDLAGVVQEFRRGFLAVTVVLSPFLVVALLRRFLWEGYFRKRRGIEVPNFAREVLGLILFIVAVIIVMDTIYELSIKGVVAGSGIAAIIIGFAMQDLLGNLIGGVALEVGRPFKVGDWLKIEDEFARVTEFNWRSVRLITNDDITLDIPNSKIVQHTIRNLQYPNRKYAVRLSVGIDYNVPPNVVKDICVRAAKNAAHVLATPPPKAFLMQFGESSIEYQIKFYMDDHTYYNDTTDAVRSNLWYELRRAGIVIPFPIRTLHIERHHRKQGDGKATAARALKLQSLFQALSEEQIADLVSGAAQERFGRRERIIEQGSNGSSMFILTEGTAEVYVAPDKLDPALVATLRSGDCFGEMSLLSGEKRSATVIAVTDCEVLEISKSSFAKLVHDQPEILEGLSELLAVRKMETEGVIESASRKEDPIATQKAIRAGILNKFYSYFEF